MLTSDYARRGFDDLHDRLSWGRYGVGILIRLVSGISSWNITQDIKLCFETSKKLVRDKLRAMFGVDIFMDMTGVETKLFSRRITTGK